MLKACKIIVAVTMIVFAPSAWAEHSKNAVKSSSELTSYTSCGCGCCGGSEPQVKCLSKAKGEKIETIIEQDKKLNASLCANAGCSPEIEYRYCDDPAKNQ